MAISPVGPRLARVRARLVLASVVVAGLAGTAAPAQANPGWVLRPDNRLLRFDTRDPANLFETLTITGLQAGEVGLAIDVRPATGQLYLLGSSSRLYILHPTSAVATAVGAPFTPALSGTRFGFDFNPTVDRIRLVSDTGQNLRLHPDTGIVTAVDTALNPATPHIVGSAYANNYAGAPTTTLYNIDSATDQLFIQNPPNNGTQVLVGALGVNTTDEVGFDITANDNVTYATLTVGVATGLYRIDLTTGAATLLTALAGGPYIDIAIQSRGVPMVALRGGNELIRFHSATPGTLLSATTVTGLQPGETLLGIDLRVENGQLYGVGSSSRLYVLNPITGTATQIGASFGPLSGTRFAVEFFDGERLYVVSDTEQTVFLDPDTAVVTAVPTFTPPGNIVGAAGFFCFIDSGTDQLLCNGFTGIAPVGPLGVDTSGDVGFDLSPLDGTHFASLTVGGVSGLYIVNVGTGAATPLGAIGTGAVVNGLAAMPLVYQFAEGSTGAFFDTDLLLANPTAATVPVTLTYQTTDARLITQSLTLPAQSRTTVSADANTQLGPTAFSSTVTSHLGVPIAVERTMRWDATGYGMHTEKAAPSVAPLWLFAEGSQGFFQTYFLLTNPGPVSNVATLRFLLENGTEASRTFPMSAQSRLTVDTGAIPELVNRSFGTVVTFVQPGMAERAMYFGTPVFNGGHASAGATRPATDWFLAEGATGSFFTTFVLLSNPNVAPANVTMAYLREGGGTVIRNKTVPPGSRLTVNVALEAPSLAATSVATRVTSDVGIVVERSMYWPFDGASWQEAHNAFGVTETARRWALAEGRVGGAAAFQTFVLVANPGSTAANLTLTILRTTGAPITKTATVAAGGRLTITTGPGSMVPELADESFGIVVASDQPVFAERALYSNANNVFWAAGSAATATALP